MDSWPAHLIEDALDLLATSPKAQDAFAKASLKDLAPQPRLAVRDDIWSDCANA